jgi:hypothetical protein
LYRVEEKTIGYKASEISFIENVMSSESKSRIHSKTKEIETVSQTATTEESETQKDLTTTQRFN